MTNQKYTDTSQNCPRCQQSFACKANTIGACQCSTIHLTKEQSQYISQQYSACLCISCLYALQQEFQQLAQTTIVIA
ncbi:MAG: hypothetical protein EOO43_23610 [Flavobacterium sp.]|nr:MAG: hypothetical protein EOO43_23610 [Flavobacterium sp.]